MSICLFIYLFIYNSSISKIFLRFLIINVDQFNIKRISFTFLSRLSILNLLKKFIRDKKAAAEIKIEIIKI